MASVTNEQVVTLAQRGRQIESLDAPTGTAPMRTITAQDDCWAIKFLKHARSDNADHAQMPGFLPLNEHEIAQWIKPSADRFDQFFRDAALDGLALAVFRVQTLRQSGGFLGVSG